MITPAEIEKMDRAALLVSWLEHFGSPAPKGVSRPFLRRFLAFEAQSQRTGGLSNKVVALLKKGSNDASPKPASPGLKPGGRLLREWNGVTHVVDVVDTGFIWNGETWRSLSAIAREITGAHWSGPRFFGLNGKS